MFSFLNFLPVINDKRQIEQLSDEALTIYLIVLYEVVLKITFESLDRCRILDFIRNIIPN